MEKLVAEQISSYLSSSSFSLHPMQFGFRAKYSTETANCFFIENIKTFLDKGGVVGAVFLDSKKAFDTVNHRILMSKLSCFNFSSHTLNWIESYLSDRFHCVRVQNHLSIDLGTSTCYGADETWDVRIHVQSFIKRRDHETGMDSIMANRYNTGTTKRNPRN